MSLSERIRPNTEAAPWVCEEVEKLERENAELKKHLRDALKQTNQANRQLAIMTTRVRVKTEFLRLAKAENTALRGALLEAWDALPADEFIEDHDPIAASTFKRLNKVLRAAIDAARTKEAQPCQCTNGIVRTVGRDNDEVIEDCPDCWGSKESQP